MDIFEISIFNINFSLMNKTHTRRLVKNILFVMFFLTIGLKSYSQYNIVYFSSEEFPFKLYVNGNLYSDGYEYECMLKDIDKGIYKCNFEFQYELFDFMYVLKVKANTFSHFAIVKTKLTAANRKFKSLNETISKDFNFKDSTEAEINKEAIQQMEFKLELNLVEEKP